ncbi:MAG: aromatic ring-hydroxylating dioxygenase subunit alpha [Spirochaetaceae bacterium]|nr:aromatic ring-hydroxylating dioxygenase subunit alpha [Spirochaetaceae bacterium]
MIRNLWYAVLESRELGDKPVSLMRLGERMVFWRTGNGTVSCFFDRCAHRGASLGGGRICGEHHDKISCPFHGLEYDVSGRCTKIPANGKNATVPPQFKMKSYPVHEEYGIIWIWWGDTPPENLSPPPFFDDLKDLKYWKTVVDPWDNHYTKVLENQLDVVHLPFVHHNTIGKGNKTLVEGPGLEWKNDTMFYHYVYNKVDDGSIPRGVKDVPVPNPDKEFKLECILPNMWENYIAKKVRVLGLFVPVDETHTLLYLRFYQNFMRMPLLRSFIMWAAGKFNLIVAHQDRCVVNTQIPKTSGIGQGEFLIQGDYPIMEFRKKRIELKKAADAAGKAGDTGKNI